MCASAQGAMPGIMRNIQRGKGPGQGAPLTAGDSTGWWRGVWGSMSDSIMQPRIFPKVLRVSLCSVSCILPTQHLSSFRHTIMDPRGEECSCLGPLPGLLSSAFYFCWDLEDNDDPVFGSDVLVPHLPLLQLLPEKSNRSY